MSLVVKTRHRHAAYDWRTTDRAEWFHGHWCLGHLISFSITQSCLLYQRYTPDFSESTSPQVSYAFVPASTTGWDSRSGVCGSRFKVDDYTSCTYFSIDMKLGKMSWLRCEQYQFSNGVTTGWVTPLSNSDGRYIR